MHRQHQRTFNFVESELDYYEEEQSINGNSSSLFTEIKGMLETIIKTQQRDVARTHKMLDEFERHLNANMDELEADYKNLAANVHALSRRKEQLFSSWETAHAVTIKSGRKLQTRTVNERCSDLKRDNVMGETEKERANEDISPMHGETEKWSVDPGSQDKSQKRKVQLNLPPYEPPLPFPGRFKKQTLERHQNQLKRILDKIEIVMPFSET